MPAEICLAVYCLDEKCIYSSCIHNTVLSASLSSDNELRYAMRHTPFCVHQDGKRNSLRNAHMKIVNDLQRKSSLEVI